MKKQSIGGGLTVKGGPVVPASRGMRVGDFLFVSGQLAFGPDGSFVPGTIEEETDRVIQSIGRILELAGYSLSDLVKCTCWITRAEDFAAFNAAYAKHFPQDPPARTTILSSLLLGAKVEIEAMAIKTS